MPQCSSMNAATAWKNIFTSQGLSTQTEELTAATYVMQSSSNESNIRISDSAKLKQTKANTNLAKSKAGFDPSLKCPVCWATLKSCHTMKQSVCGWQYMYIYIYVIIFLITKFQRFRLIERLLNYNDTWACLGSISKLLNHIHCQFIFIFFLSFFFFFFFFLSNTDNLFEP